MPSTYEVAEVADRQSRTFESTNGELAQDDLDDRLLAERD